MRPRWLRLRDTTSCLATFDPADLGDEDADDVIDAMGLRRKQQRRFELVTSDPLLRELRDVLIRRGGPVAGADAYVALLTNEAAFVRIYGVPMGCPDPGDDKVVSLREFVDELHGARPRFSPLVIATLAA